MSNSHDWLSLVEVSGPFLAVPVLRVAFPQGLEALLPGRSRRLRQAYDEWRDLVDAENNDLSELHAAWIDEVLRTALDVNEANLRKRAALPEHVRSLIPEHGVTFGPDLAVVNPTNADEMLLPIHVYEPDADLDAKSSFDGLNTPADRMVSLLRAAGCPIGIATNGERWMLIHAPAGAVAGFASWYARIWGQEPETLRAFVSLLGAGRLFGSDEESLPTLYERSLEYQDDVTEALGEQVRRAVEELVQALDRADQDRNRELLRDVEPRELYEAGLTVMMRLVFLLAAEQRGLLLLGDPIYDSFYAVSSLRMQLRVDSEEILERRRSAWSRLLALSRSVHGGLDHPTLCHPALGGSLFDPDRYPFLEGRQKGTKWRTDPSEPLPIDDRTVLLLLEAIQIYDGRTLSYRALDVEQIGHVYEGLLERTVCRVEDVTLELESSGKARNPRVTLGEVEKARRDGEESLIEILRECSGKSESIIRNALDRDVDDRLSARLLTACRDDIELQDRILPLAHLLRIDHRGYPLVHHKGAFVVVLGADRRDSGTHYTPKNLTEKIVEETLTPVSFRGPAEGAVREDWELKSAEELLDLKICDPAMGSGAFLVQACRWISDRLVEAWSATEASGKRIDSEGRIVEDVATESFDPLSQDAEERAIVARRLVAERCLYGVDKNPLAVELAKLSLWLTTMSKGRPFGFLDHNLRSGDSLLGINEIRQIAELNMNPKGSKQLRLFNRSIQSAVKEAIELRMRLRSIPIRDIRDVNAMAALDAKSRDALMLPQLVSDAFVGIVLAEKNSEDRVDRLQELENFADLAANGDVAAIDRLRRDAFADLGVDAPDGLSRDPFHWPIEFPEVFDSERDGFDAFIGNPPFIGGKRLPSVTGPAYGAWLVAANTGSSKNADIAVHFFRRAWIMLRRGGGLGLLATNSIAEGANRQSGLEWMVRDGAKIYSATYPGEKWPGRAAVDISRVHLRKGEWLGDCKIFDDIVDEISPFLTSGAQWSLVPLKKNSGLAYQGSIPLGKGFLLDKETANWMLDSDPKNKEVIFPYLNGQDLNSDPQQEPSRFTINFWDWPEERAKEYELPFQWTYKNVYPKRLEKSKEKSYKGVDLTWWQHLARRSELYHSIGRGHHFQEHPADWDPESLRPSRVLVVACTSKTLAFSYVSPEWVYSNATNVFSSDCPSMFAVLQSNIHAVFAWQHTSRMKNDLRYALRNALEPFPFPDTKNSNRLHVLAIELDDLRRKIMITKDFGLTKLYGEMHLRETSTPENDRMKELHREIDRNIARSYGWDDLDLGHGFHEVSYLPKNSGSRFTISEAARTEVLRRLSELNKQCHDEETECQKPTKSSKSKRSRSRTIQGQNEFGFEASARQSAQATGGMEAAAEKILSHLETQDSWLSRSDILTHVDIPEGQWSAAIKELLESGAVERQGERRGARYRISRGD